MCIVHFGSWWEYPTKSSFSLVSDSAATWAAWRADNTRQAGSCWLRDTVSDMQYWCSVNRDMRIYEYINTWTHQYMNTWIYEHVWIHIDLIYRKGHPRIQSHLVVIKPRSTSEYNCPYVSAGPPWKSAVLNAINNVLRVKEFSKYCV